MDTSFSVQRSRLGFPGCGERACAQRKEDEAPIACRPSKPGRRFYFGVRGKM
jgi:hypothetical protein